jgi:hypothetical protein
MEGSHANASFCMAEYATLSMTVSGLEVWM